MRPGTANAAVLEDVLAAMARADLGRVARRFAADGTYREAHGKLIHGRAAIAEHFARYAASGVPYRFDVDGIIDGGERACVIYRFATPGGSGEPWRERAGCATVRLDDRGQIVEWREYDG